MLMENVEGGEYVSVGAACACEVPGESSLR